MGSRKWVKHTRVLGIDLGSQRSSVADLEYTECIESFYSEPPVAKVHSLPSVMTFRRHNRVFAVAAAAAAQSSEYGTPVTVQGLKRLLGRTWSDLRAEGESGLKTSVIQGACGPALVETSSSAGLPDSVGLRLPHAGRAATFSVEQLTAMLLKRLTEQGSGGVGARPLPLTEQGADCVISVPGHFGEAARRSVATAAGLVKGLNCLALVNETTAAAAEYAWTTAATRLGLAGKRKQRSSSSNVVVVVDLGQSGCQVAAYAIEEEGRVLRILASACDLEVSGKAFDEVLVRHFCQELKDKYQLSVTRHRHQRLTLECEKLKCQMSSTSRDLLLDGESLLEPFELTRPTLPKYVSMNRERFEKMCGSLLDKVDGLLRTVMEQAGLNAPDDVHAVRIVGGASRMPAARRRIGEFFGGVDKLDDASDDGAVVARGCAILCSLLEPAVPTWRKLVVYDLNTPYPVVPGTASSSAKSRSVPKLPVKGTPLDKQLVDRFVEEEATRTAKDRLVEYMDEIREAVEGPLQAFVGGASEQTLLLQAVADAEKWMDDGKENERCEDCKKESRTRLETAEARIGSEMYKLERLFRPVKARHKGAETISQVLDDVHRVVEDYAGRVNSLGKTDVEERLSQAREWLREKRGQFLQDPTQKPRSNYKDIFEYKDALERYLSDQDPESAKNTVSEYIREMMLEVGDGGPLKRFAVKEEERAALLKGLEDAMAWLEQEGEDRQPQVYEDKRDQLETRIKLFRESCDKAKIMMGSFAELCLKVWDQAKYVKKAHREKYDRPYTALRVLNRSEQCLYETRTWLEDQMDAMMMKQDLMQEHDVSEIGAHHEKLQNSAFSLQSVFQLRGLQ